MDNQKSDPHLPPFTDLFLKIPIYDEIDVTNIDTMDIGHLKYYSGALDAHCLYCKRVSVFKKTSFPRSSVVPMPSAPYSGKRPSTGVLPRLAVILPNEKAFKHNNETFSVELACIRDDSHRIEFIFKIHNDVLTKIGQFPSIADFHLPDLDRYAHVLDEEPRKEFARAIGLHAHGIGIGAFVYLRRIFEGLIEQAHKVAMNDSSWSEESYKTLRMDDKIKLLAAQLPEVLVTNAGMYSILSKGIHILSEKECQEFFATLKLGIELILDEKTQQEAKRKTTEALTKEIAVIQGKIK